MKTLFKLFSIFCLFTLVSLGGDNGLATAAPTCTDPALEEARITEQLAKEPNRPHLVVEGYPLEIFLTNMKTYFDAEPHGIDKVYIILGLRPLPDLYVHLFLLREGCIVYYTRTSPFLIAEMLKKRPNV